MNASRTIALAAILALQFTAAKARAADCSPTGQRRAAARGAAAAAKWVTDCQNPKPADPAPVAKPTPRRKPAPATNGLSEKLDDLNLRLKTVEDIVIQPKDAPWNPTGWQVILLIVLGLAANRLIIYFWEKKRNEWKSNAQRIDELVQQNEELSAALVAMADRLIALESSAPASPAPEPVSAPAPSDIPELQKSA